MRLCSAVYSQMSKNRLNAYIGQLKNSTALLGMLHACYGLGCAISPIVATRMVSAGLGWNSYYFVLLGWSITNSLVIGITYHPKFMRSTPEELMELPSSSVDTNSNPSRTRGPLYIVLTNRLCWFLGLYLVLYLGIEISTGGWVVEFMIQVGSHLSF